MYTPPQNSFLKSLKPILDRLTGVFTTPNEKIESGMHDLVFKIEKINT